MADLATSSLRAGPFPLKRILVLSDLTDAAANAAWRAALLAQEHGAWLRIVHLRGLGEDAAAAQRRLDALAWQLQEHLRIAVLAQSVRGGLRRELALAAPDVDLIVTRGAPGRWARDWLAGIHPERIAQLSGRPTLVVRRAAAVPYQRVIAAVRHGPHVGACIAAAAGMAGGPHAALLAELAADGKLLPRDDPGFESRAGQVEARIHELAQASPGARMKEAPCVLFTRSVDVLLEKERALFPDLVVVPRTAGRLPPWLTPSLSRRLLVRTAADTLILPAAPEAASAPTQHPGELSPVLGAHGAKVWPS